MTVLWLASYILLWLLVIIQGLLLLAVAREVQSYSRWSADSRENHEDQQAENK